MAYVYKHIRKDTNEVFYIGIGSDSEYLRANDFNSRNLYWKNIVNKVGYISEIIETNLTWESACKKEIELIKHYGRKDLNEGCLVNMTNGGDGSFGRICKKETLDKLSKLSKGRKMTKQAIDKMVKSRTGTKRTEKQKQTARESSTVNKKIIQYDLFGNYIKEWNSMHQAAKSEMHLSQSGISCCCNGSRNNHGGYIWKLKN